MGAPYAHALWGLTLAWTHRGAPGEVRDHFTAAVAGRRERAFVRRLQVAALLDARSAASEAELLRVVNAIRQEGGTVDAGPRRGLHGMYWSRMPDAVRRPALLAALPADVHLATYRWLFAADLRDTTREASYTLYLAQLQEHAGDTAGALAAMRRLRALPTAWRTGERAVIDAALARAASPH